MNPMRNRLLWKLLLTNVLPVIGVIIFVVWLAVEVLAAKYFMALMDVYEVSPDEIHQMFLSSIRYYLIWAFIAALALAILLSYLLTRRVLRPLLQMTAITKEMAAGDFSFRAEITTRDEVGELGQAFNQMADSLEKIEGLRKTMVADVAHELRTPLTNLRGYLEGLDDGVIEASDEVFLLLQQETLRLVDLVESLAQLAKADAADAYLERKELACSDLLDAVVSLHRHSFLAKEIAVQVSHGEDLRIRGDRDKLLQAFGNCMANCCKYTPHQGRVAISSEQLAEGVKIIFENTGPGIAREDLPYIFERFFRAERSRNRAAGGAGIGLAITRELIKAHGGKVGATSQPGQTRIWLFLPH